MIITLIITAIVIAGLSYLLFTPVILEISYDITGRKLGPGNIRFYPFSYKLKFEKKVDKAEAKKVVAKKARKKAAKKSKRPKINFIALVRDEIDLGKTVINAAFRLLKGLIAAPEYRLFISLSGGLPEPHLTGYLCGGIKAIGPVLGESIALSYAPDFNSEKLGGEVTGRAALRISMIIKELLIFAARLPKLRLLKVYFKIRKGGGNG